MQNSSMCADAYPPLGLAGHTSLTTATFHGLYGQLKRFINQAANKYHGLNKRLDIADLKQVGLIALWKAHRSFKPEQGFPIEHYARRAIVNEILKECQRGQSRQEVLYHDCVSESVDGADCDDVSVIELLNATQDGEMDPVFQAYAGQEICAVLCSQDVPLTNSQRQVIDLLYRQGLKIQEAADLLGVSHQSVSKQHRKAIDVCRSYLGVTLH